MIDKAVILAAGMGMRFYPYTRYVAKKMLALIDTPAIQLIIEEVIQSGIKKICVVSSERKISLNFFLKQFSQSYPDIELTTIFQTEADGTGNALLTAKTFCDGQPTVVLNGDDLILNQNSPATKQLIKAYESVNAPIIGGQFVTPKEISRYGAIIAQNMDKNPFIVDGIAEKATANKAPSLFASLGRYVITNGILTELNDIKPAQNGEYLLTDAFNEYARKNKLYACEFKGKRYDLGSKLGYLKAVTDIALEREDTSTEFCDYIREIATTEFRN